MSGPPVVDLRSRGVRGAEALWSRWRARPHGWLSPLVRGTEAVRRRRLAARLDGRDAPAPDRLVVSVGNLKLGGTGKTPVTRDLALRLSDAGRGGVVLCRGYRAARRAPCRVGPGDAACGDEARLLAGALAWPVVQAADRVAGMELARSLTAPGDVVLLEDGHQTAGLGRHEDVLILDRWTVEDGGLVPAAGPALPWGPYREGAEGAARATALIVEDRGEGEIPDLARDGRPVFAFRRRVVAPADLPAGPVGVVCGLADPTGFEEACAALLGRAPACLVRLDDHASYTDAVRRSLADLVGVHELTGWLPTEKDGVKLDEPGRSPGAPVLEAGLELDWTGRDPAAWLLNSRKASP